MEEEVTMEEVEADKPQVQLTGTDGNVFALLGLCTRALRKAGQADQAKELAEKVMASGSYDEALALMAEYCEVW
jgi:hypothetical protein